MQHATCNVQHVTCNVKRATCNLQRVTCSLIIFFILGLSGCAEEGQAPLTPTTTTTTLPPPQASLVLGQVDFAKNTANLVDASGFFSPSGVAVDATAGVLYVADAENSRILGFSSLSALSTGTPADIVIGQADLDSSLCNQGGTVSPTTLCNPRGVAVDSSGHLYVADTENIGY